MTDEMHDHPFDEVLANANRLITEKGAVTFQKYTCAHCGVRLGMSEANKFFTEGRCEQCGGLTNIKERGCNFMAILKVGKQTRYEPGME